MSNVDPGLATLLSASSWYDLRDLVSSSDNTLRNRNNPAATAAQFGSTSGSDTNDPVRLPHSGTNYVYLPGTASNNLSIPKDGGWAGTLHVTATLVDDTTATFTTTASPILIGNTLLSAGRYKRFDVRDTNGSGTLRVTINVATETIGQTSWTCTTGQTVTVNRSTSGLTTAVVTRPIAMFDGTDDYLQLPPGDTPTVQVGSGAYTGLIAFRAHGGGTSGRRLVSFELSSSTGVLLYQSGSGGTGAIMRDGATTASITQASSFAASSLTVLGLVVGGNSFYIYSSSAGLSSPGSYAGLSIITYPSAGRLAAASFATLNAATGTTVAYVSYNRALTITELDAASAYLLGSYA